MAKANWQTSPLGDFRYQLGDVQHVTPTTDHKADIKDEPRFDPTSGVEDDGSPAVCKHCGQPLQWFADTDPSEAERAQVKLA